EEGGEIPVGTYIGTPAIPSILQAGQIDENEVTIIVEEDGTTHGERILIYSGTESGMNDEPVYYTDEWKVTFDGILQGAQGELTGIFFNHLVTHGPGTDDPQNTTDSYGTVYDVHISGDIMSCSLKEADREIYDDEWDVFSFEATKQ
ncbi:MAG: hypothetical protein MUQ30_15580, partial [Anaerolineae bacterium]|nr:hypothetical protein [Anaerolineae bacterium]